MGMVWGSFFNVCIFRIPAQKSIVSPPSHCGTCGTCLRPWQNVPVLGWFFLRGRCTTCGQAYGFRYPLVELLTGGLFLMAYLQAGPLPALLLHLVFLGLLIIGIFTDIDHFILPNRITLGGCAFMVLVSPLAGSDSFAAWDLVYIVNQTAFWSNSSLSLDGWSAWHQALAGSVFGALFGYGLLAGVAFLGRVMFQKEAMGQGDVKLFAMIGAFLGAVNAFLILFLASFIGLIVGVYALASHRLVGRDQLDKVVIRAYDLPDGQDPVTMPIDIKTSRSLRELPFGPHIAVASLLVLFFQADVRDAFHMRLDAFAPPLGVLRLTHQELLPGVPVPAFRLLPTEEPQ
jgi:leader peptidase (prepilin peptidase)/N-methyltransferase